MSLKLSLPTKKQVFKTLELALVAFGATFFSTLALYPNVDKAALVGAAGAGLGAAYRVVKSLVTDL